MNRPDTEELIHRAGKEDRGAADQLLGRHTARLRRMIRIRMDARLAPRVDPSDVVQETLIEAARKLPKYLRERPLEFYPWLRQLASNRLIDLHRRHVMAEKRTVTREEPLGLSSRSQADLAGRLLASGISPSGHLLRQEQRERVRSALAQLAAHDREVLVLWYLERLSAKEIAAVLGVSEGAVNMRHSRALERLRRLLGRDD